MNRNHLPSILQALVAAVLFGVSAPLAKVLLGELDPIPLAGLLYLGSGIGVLIVRLVQGMDRQKVDREARLEKSDALWLLGAVLAGGVAAPIVLLFSLKNTPGATASLLLNFEGVATTLIAILVFREAVSRRTWWAIALVTLASIALSLNPLQGWGVSAGALGIIAACVLWGLDNNFTRNISAKDPLVIVMIKGLGAGSFSLLLGWLLGYHLPGWDVVLKAFLLGSLSYGLSIVLFIRALRGLGAARTSALFGTAPIAGVLVSFLIFREFPGWMFVAALPLMALGAYLLVVDQHGHTHLHEKVVHEHAHTHQDGHHQHPHDALVSGSHSHIHTHEQEEHSHQHMPDTHHRHTHPADPTGDR